MLSFPFVESRFGTLKIYSGEYLDIEKLKDLLDYMSKKTFDREILIDIFQKVKKNNENRVVLREVINVFVETEQRLLSRKNELNKNLNVAGYENSEFDKLLKLKLIDGQFDSQLMEKDESVKVVFESLNQKFTSEYSSLDRPFWNNFFQIPINNEIDISLYNNEDVLIGCNKIEFNRSFNDHQHPTEKWIAIELLDKEIGRIKVELQIISLGDKRKELEEIIYYLETIYSPFGSLSLPLPIQNEKEDSPIIEELPTIMSKYIDFLIYLVNFFAILVCFNRSAFLDLSIIGAFTIFKQKGKLGNQILRIFGGCFLVSGLFDILWLLIFSKYWWNIDEGISDGITNGDLIADQESLLRFVVVMTYFLLVTKIVTGLALFTVSIARNDF